MVNPKIINGIGCLLAFSFGMLIASYHPLPGINVTSSGFICPEQNVCPTGFATVEEMSHLVKELRVCKGEEQ